MCSINVMGGQITNFELCLILLSNRISNRQLFGKLKLQQMQSLALCKRQPMYYSFKAQNCLCYNLNTFACLLIACVCLKIQLFRISSKLPSEIQIVWRRNSKMQGLNLKFSICLVKLVMLFFEQSSSYFYFLLLMS